MLKYKTLWSLHSWVILFATFMIVLTLLVTPGHEYGNSNLSFLFVWFFFTLDEQKHEQSSTIIRCAPFPQFFLQSRNDQFLCSSELNSWTPLVVFFQQFHDRLLVGEFLQRGVHLVQQILSQQEALGVVHRHANPVVCYTVLGEVVGSNLLWSAFGANLEDWERRKMGKVLIWGLIYVLKCVKHKKGSCALFILDCMFYLYFALFLG